MKAFGLMIFVLCLTACEMGGEPVDDSDVPSCEEVGGTEGNDYFGSDGIGTSPNFAEELCEEDAASIGGGEE